jgi:hypothetical protein
MPKPLMIIWRLEQLPYTRRRPRPVWCQVWSGLRALLYRWGARAAACHIRAAWRVNVVRWTRT